MNIKITDEQFLETFYEQKGKYTGTAKALEKKYGVVYTRQAVYKRAKNFPKEAEQLREDSSTYKLLPFADDEGNDIRLRIRIHTMFADQLTKYTLGRLAAEAKPPVQYDKAMPVDLSHKLMLLAKQNESLQKNSTN
jgi:hypothetical protein